MHGYKWPINCTRTRIPSIHMLSELETAPDSDTRLSMVRLTILGNETINDVGKSESCMVLK